MGVLTPGSAHARTSAQPPIDVSRKFPAHMFAVLFLKFSHFPVKIGLGKGGGEGGGVPDFFYWNPHICVT